MRVCAPNRENTGGWLTGYHVGRVARYRGWNYGWQWSWRHGVVVGNASQRKPGNRDDPAECGEQGSVWGELDF